ncbi:MAG: ribonuclease P protein component [Chloroflexi bacterium]|nr:ribonuclease P protein component [Chloroflexota bacterium]
MLSQGQRLSRTSDIQRLLASRPVLHHDLVTLRALPNELEVARAGIVCGKRVGGAVVRNQARRRLRSALREAIASVPSGWDILLVIRSRGASASVAAFGYALDELLLRRGLKA